MADLSGPLRLVTPEGVTFTLQPAGPVVRFLAWLVDVACVFVGVGLLQGAMVFFSILSPDLGNALLIIAGFLASMGYAMVLEWFWRGQTLGKRLLGLRVMDARGLKLSFSQVMVRNLLRAVDSLPLFYTVGGISCLVTRHSQRLGDLAASTVVVRSPQVTAPDIKAMLHDKYNSFREHPLACARLRQKVSPWEATVALRALIRRDRLDPVARVELFRQLADTFRDKADFPKEVTGDLTDERYVRNVLDVVFSQRQDIGFV